MTTRRRIILAPKLQHDDNDDRTADAPTYSLLQLPPDLLAYLSSSSSPPLEIRGHHSDAAVLVTPERTYALRGVQNSNSILLCSSGADATFAPPQVDGRVRKEIHVHTTLHETLEVIPAVARTDRLEALLAHTEYTGEDAEENSRGACSLVTFADLQAQAPACDSAIASALRASRVVAFSSNRLRRLPPSFLLNVLPPLLASLPPPKKGLRPEVTTSHSELLDTLDAADCGAEAAQKVLELFGSAMMDTKDKWTLRVTEIVREVAVCLLAQGGYGAQPLAPFLAQWKTLCAAFSGLCALPLISDTTLPLPLPPTTITYYPLSILSPDPAQRFAELFAARPRWKEEDMTKFIDDLVGGEKKRRDAMVLKFVRKVKEGGGTVWTARNNW